MIRTAFYALAIAALAYVVVFVPVGKRTLYEHGTRIAATPEAKELGGSVSELVGEAKQKVVSEALAHAP